MGSIDRRGQLGQCSCQARPSGVPARVWYLGERRGVSPQWSGRRGHAAPPASHPGEAAMTDVLCAGIIVADHVSSPIDHLPSAGELVLADQLLLTIGGCAANVAVDLGKLGVSASVVGRVGGDVFGRIVAEMLAERQVDVSALQITPDRD